MDLRTLGNPCPAFDGLVTVYMRPYQSLKVSAQIDALQAITPQFLWRHKTTGEETTKEPAAYATAEKAAEEFETEIMCEWEKERLWTLVHDTFTFCEPDTLAADFVTDQPLPAEVRALKMYFENRNGSVAKNWELFNELLSMNTITEWWKVYDGTRDKAMDLPPNTTPDEGDTAKNG
jgi:hypothetical protein